MTNVLVSNLDVFPRSSLLVGEQSEALEKHDENAEDECSDKTPRAQRSGIW